MPIAYRRSMEALYLACVVVAGTAILVMTLVIPYGVFMRYAMNAAASWPEPLAILMMIVFTFIGAAACCRARAHIAVNILAPLLPVPWARAARVLVELLMALLCLFMVVWGVNLVGATWHQVIAEFPFLKVGVTYLPIPVGGAITLLFLLEQAWLGPPGPDSIVHREPASLD